MSCCSIASASTPTHTCCRPTTPTAKPACSVDALLRPPRKLKILVAQIVLVVQGYRQLSCFSKSKHFERWYGDTKAQVL